MVKGRADPRSPAPDHRGLKLFIGIGFLAALMLFLFWPIIRSLMSLVPG